MTAALRSLRRPLGRQRVLTLRRLIKFLILAGMLGWIAGSTLTGLVVWSCLR